MPAEHEIRTRYKVLHDDLSNRYYKNHELSKEEFDTQHGKIWTDMEAELIAEGYITPPEPARDLAAEIDVLKVKVDELEKKVKGGG